MVENSCDSAFFHRSGYTNLLPGNTYSYDTDLYFERYDIRRQEVLPQSMYNTVKALWRLPHLISYNHRTCIKRHNGGRVTIVILVTQRQGGHYSRFTLENNEMKDLLDIIPEHVRILALKTDMQGFDVTAIKSAGEDIRRIDEILHECIGDDEELEYDAAPVPNTFATPPNPNSMMMS